MANAWEQVDSIAAEALMHMEDALVITARTARDKTADFNKTQAGYSVGDTVRIKTRPDYEAKEFAGAIEIQEIRESKRQMAIEKHFDVSVNVTAKEKALDLESFVEQVIQPAAYRLAEKAESYVAGKIVQGAGLYASDAVFGSSADMALARGAASFQQLSPTGRFCLVNDTLESQLLGATWFNTHNDRGETGESILNEGVMGRTMGMEFLASYQFPIDNHAAAGNGTSTTDNGVAVGGVFPNNKIGSTTLTIDALTGQIEAGDRIKIAGVRRPLIAAAQAVATATTVTLVDPITEIIPDGAAVTVIGSGQSNLDLRGAIFDDQSLAVAMPVLDAPSDKPSSVLSNNGFSIRVVQGYDMTTKTDTLSLDMLIGASAYDPRRITLLREF
jgi:hypothetical protein